jgi:hypothetical protein
MAGLSNVDATSSLGDPMTAISKDVDIPYGVTAASTRRTAISV